MLGLYNDLTRIQLCTMCVKRKKLPNLGSPLPNLGREEHEFDPRLGNFFFFTGG